MWAIHAETPHALFDACAQAGIRRVVHVSALGLEGNPTQYARSRLRAEAQLMALTAGGALEGVIVRPSVVFGRGGASSELFMMLARSPLWLLPAPVVRTRIQPVAVTRFDCPGDGFGEHACTTTRHDLGCRPASVDDCSVPGTAATADGARSCLAGHAARLAHVLERPTGRSAARSAPGAVRPWHCCHTTMWHL